MNPNLPCGVTDNMIDNHFDDELQAFEDNYLDFHYDDVQLFNHWFNRFEEGEIRKHKCECSSIALSGMHFLIEFPDLAKMWEQFLREEASKDYWEGRLEPEE